MFPKSRSFKKIHLLTADQLQFSVVQLLSSLTLLAQQERDSCSPSSLRIMAPTRFLNFIASTVCALLESSSSFCLMLIKVPYLVRISNKLNQDF